MAVEDAGIESATGRELDASVWVPRSGIPVPGRKPRRSRRPVPGAPEPELAGPATERAERTDETPRPDPVSTGVRITAEDVEDVVVQMRTRPDADLVELVEAHLARGITLERAYLDLLAPMARRLGELWDEDLCDYFQVTLLVGRIQGAIRRMGPYFQAAAGDGGRPQRRVFLTAPGREQHTLGMVLVGDFFLRAGWSVSMGSPLDPGRGVLEVARDRFDLVGISLSRDATLEETRESIRAIRRDSRNPGVRVILGGRVLHDSPEVVRLLGADAWASDGLEAITVAGELCGNPR